MQTCQNDLGLNLCVVPPTSYMVAISEIDLVKSYKERSKVSRSLTVDFILFFPCHFYFTFLFF